jgi:hypothetical protein
MLHAIFEKGAISDIYAPEWSENEGRANQDHRFSPCLLLQYSGGLG